MGASEKIAMAQWQERGLAKLREPFPEEDIELRPVYVGPYDFNSEGRRFVPASAVQKCPRCGKTHALPARHLKYVGHARVTERLLDVDPAWSWRFLAVRDDGSPVITRDGLWMALTVCGVERIGFGDAGGKDGPDAVKEMIGDAIRNAAMRFGCGLEMWMEGDDEVTYPPDGDDGRPAFKPHLSARATRAQRRLAEAIEARHTLGLYDGNELAEAILVEFAEPYYRMNEQQVEGAMEFLDEAFPVPPQPCDGQDPLFGDDVEVIPV